MCLELFSVRLEETQQAHTKFHFSVRFALDSAFVSPHNNYISLNSPAIVVVVLLLLLFFVVRLQVDGTYKSEQQKKLDNRVQCDSEESLRIYL